MSSEKNAKIAKTSNKTFPTKYYLVFSQVVSPVYDIHVICNNDMYLSKEEAIASAKVKFIEEVNKSFRGGVGWTLSNIEKYTADKVRGLWESSECAAACDPVLVEVIEFDLMNAQDRKNYKKVIYSLPRNSPNKKDNDDDDDNEDDKNDEDHDEDEE